MLNVLLDKIDVIQQQIGKVNREMETQRLKKKKERKLEIKLSTTEMRKTSDDLTSRLVIAEESVSELSARVSQQKPPKLERNRIKTFQKKKKERKEKNIQVLWNNNKRYMHDISVRTKREKEYLKDQ